MLSFSHVLFGGDCRGLVQEDGSVVDFLVANESFGILDRHEDLPAKRWRDNVEQWTSEVGYQDPIPYVTHSRNTLEHKNSRVTH